MRFTELKNILKDHEKIKSEGCCKKKCIEDVSLDNVYDLRTGFHQKNEKGQRQFILDYLRDIKFGKLHLFVNSNQVCRKAWCHCYGMSLRRYVFVFSKNLLLF